MRRDATRRRVELESAPKEDVIFLLPLLSVVEEDDVAVLHDVRGALESHLAQLLRPLLASRRHKVCERDRLQNNNLKRSTHFP